MKTEKEIKSELEKAVEISSRNEKKGKIDFYNFGVISALKWVLE